MDAMSFLTNMDLIDLVLILVIFIILGVIWYGFTAILKGNTILYNRLESLNDSNHARVELENEKRRLNEEIYLLQQELERLQVKQDSLGDIKQSFGKIQSDYEVLLTQYQEKQKQLNELDNEISRSDALKKLIDETREHEINTLEQTIADKKKELDELTKSIVEQKEQVNSDRVFDNVLQNIGKHVQSANEQKNLNQEISSLQNKKVALEKEIADQSKTLASQDTEKQLVELLKKACASAYLEHKAEMKAQQQDEKQFSLNDFKALLDFPLSIKNYINQENQFLNRRVEPISEEMALAKFETYLLQKGLYYSKRQIYAFHTSLKVQNISPLSVLAGVSGTGKTQLAISYGTFFNFFTQIVSVQPRWDSNDDLLGFYNFLEKLYSPTELVKVLYHFDPENKGTNPTPRGMLLVVLDEMNLARVEYYFSEFLSKLELRKNRKQGEKDILISNSQGKLGFNIGSNVLFVGTMNDDESTFALSDKVLDRSNVLQFTSPSSFDIQNKRNQQPQQPIYVSAKQFNSWIDQKNNTSNPDLEEIKRLVTEINNSLKAVGKGFGHRVEQSILAYVRQYPGKDNYKIALADQIEMKIIPKLMSLEKSDNADSCLEKLLAIINNLDKNLAQAFNSAFDSYNNNNIFIWYGVDHSEKAMV